jgi:nitric oxide reductase NorQ protein
MAEVKCPQCGQMVLESALRTHLERVCPKRDGQDKSNLEKEVTLKPRKEAPPVVETTQATKDISVSSLPIPIPTGEANFWISAPNRERLSRIASRSEKGDIINCLIRGPKGCGKTTLAREYAYMFHSPFYEMHCGALVDAEQWFGKDRLNGDGTWYRKARFIQAIETPNSVVLLDEINRAHPEVLNAIFGILDWRRSIWSDDLGYEVKVSKGVVFFATINEGDDYYGINPLDSALRDRFPRTLKLGYPPRREEVKILQSKGLDKNMSEKLALFANTLRKATNPIPVSTRQLLVAAEELLYKASLREAVETAVISGLEDGMDKMSLQALQWLEASPYVDDETEIPEEVIDG